MTDYLEELLDEQETCEDGKTGMDWTETPQPTGRLRAQKSDAGAIGTAPGAQVPQETALTQTAQRLTAPAGGEGQTAQRMAGREEAAAPQPPRYLDSRYGMGRQGAARGESLYRALVRTGRAAEYARRETPPLTTAAGDGRVGGGAHDIAALDRIFQRDARRYDGGFPLY